MVSIDGGMNDTPHQRVLQRGSFWGGSKYLVKHVAQCTCGIGPCPISLVDAIVGRVGVPCIVWYRFWFHTSYHWSCSFALFGYAIAWWRFTSTTWCDTVPCLFFILREKWPHADAYLNGRWPCPWYYYVVVIEFLYFLHAFVTDGRLLYSGFVLEGNDLRVNFMLDALLPLGLLTDDNDNLAIAL